MSSESEPDEFQPQQSSGSLAPGEIFSFYQIIRKIGHGGMGEIYLAEDKKLSRPVVLKFLPEWLDKQAEAKARLLHEARAASKVNHPNLVSIYAIEQVGNRDFIVMEFVEGITLSEFKKDIRVSLDTKIDIALQIAAGLNATHGESIVHCDLKSDNIIVNSSGQVKILDFGLAICGDFKKAFPERITAGTLPYSSPEQLQGSDIDQRSDIFSFGVVLYELLTGTLPFTGEYEAAVIYSIINDEPRPLIESDERFPPKLQHIISRMLEKNPENRYANVLSIIEDLRGLDKSESIDSKKTFSRKRALKVATLTALIAAALIAIFYILSNSNTPRTAHRAILAVLPFENLGQPEDEYFADGITDAVITELAKSHNIGVISLSSTMGYKQSKKKIEQIGGELGADYILVGTVQWNKTTTVNKISVNPKLIEVKNSTYLWADTFNPDLNQVFSLQANIANGVSQALDLASVEQKGKSAEKPPTGNIAAYDYLLRGNIYFYRGWEENDLLIAESMYEKAIELDSNFALAYAMLSRTDAALYWDYYDRTESRLAGARKTLDESFRLDPELPEAKLALGNYYYSQMEYEAALKSFLDVLKVRPNDVEAIAAVAGVYRRKGELDLATQYYVQAFKLDPRSNIRAFDVGLAYGMKRDYSQAIDYLEQGIQLAPDWPMSYILKAWLTLFWRGDIEAARRILADASSKADLESTEYYWWLLRIVEPDYRQAISKSILRTDTTSYYLHLARLYRLSNQEKLQRVYSDSARMLLEPKVMQYPENARFQSQLGLADAGIGLRDEAILHGLKATTIMPPAREAIYSLFFLVNLAEIYTITGNYDQAIDLLDYSMKIPGFVSAPYLKLDPVWRPLQDQPRFQKLLTESEPQAASRQ